MDTALWICQVFLAITFGYSGVMKSTRSREELISGGQTGVAGLSYRVIRFIGISEVVGAIGIVVPWLTGILPVLTPVTAVCFALIMILAAPIHYSRGEFRSVGINITLLLTSLFVVYMRFQALGE
jgi:uncharacterized membrane protein YphA (DoxX/SURF4 family)